MTRARRDDVGGVVLGVDLGTCYSAAAVCLDGVDAEVLCNDIGDPTTPTCVYVDADGADRQVGEPAVRLAVSDPASTVRNVKCILGVTLDAIRRYPGGPSGVLGSVEVVRAVGSDRPAIRVGASADLAPEEIASSVLIELKKAAEVRLGRAVQRAVVAVPGYFNAAQRSAVRDAAALAGLEAVRLVNETSAAALAYAHGREGQGSKTVVVVDVGGGGGAVSVVKVHDVHVRVLAASGLRLPGGEDFDREMVEYLKQVVKDEHGKEVTDPRSVELLRSHWEKAKRKLMQLPHAKIATFLPGDVDVDLHRLVKRAEFEERCEPLFQRVAQQLRETLQKAEVGVDGVDDVVLVGGSTRIPRLRSLIQEAVAGRPLCKAVNADEAVAKGAALLGAGLVHLQDVTPLHLAVLGGGRECSLLRNTVLPADGRMPPVGAEDAVMVRQGCLDDELTVVFEATRASPLPRDAHSFRLDESGLLHLVDEQGNEIGGLCLHGCLSAEALADLRSGTERRLQDNLADLQRAEAKNSLEEKSRALLSAENEVADDHPDADLVADLRTACEGHLSWLYDEDEQRRLRDADEYRRRLEDLDSFRLELVERRDERKRVDTARKTLEEICLDLLNQEQEVTDDHPEAVLIRWLRQECSEQLTWLETTKTCNKRDVEMRLKAVNGLWSDLQGSREAAEAAAARSDLANTCTQILYSELKRYLCSQDFAELAEEGQAHLQWLNNNPHAAKGDYEDRLWHIEETKKKVTVKAQAAAQAAAQVQAAAEAQADAIAQAAHGRGTSASSYATVASTPAPARPSAPGKANNGSNQTKTQLTEYKSRSNRRGRSGGSRPYPQKGVMMPQPAGPDELQQLPPRRAHEAPALAPAPIVAVVLPTDTADRRGQLGQTDRSGDCDGESDTSPVLELEECWEPGHGGATSTRAESEDPAAAMGLVRVLYRRVFNEEAHRRRSHLRQPIKSVQKDSKATVGPRAECVLRDQDDVLRALARQVAEDALREAKAAGRVALLVDEVVVPGRCVLAALTARYVRGESDRAPVERLLLLQDAYLTSGADLMRRLDELAAAEGSDWLAAAVCGVSWEDDSDDGGWGQGRGLVSAAGRQLLQLVRDRWLRHHDPGSDALLLPDCGPRRLWGGGHSLDRRIADECERQHREARDFLKTLSDLKHVFEGPRLGLLRRRSQSATASTWGWGSARDVVDVIARPGGVETVVGALGDLQTLDPSLAIDSLLDSIRSTAFIVCTRIFDALFFAFRDVGKLLAFCGPTDVSVVDRCSDHFWSRLRMDTGTHLRLRFQSARSETKLADRLLASARAAVQACVNECAAPLWLRHAIATGEDEPRFRVPAELRRDVLGELRRCREQLGVHTSDPRALVAAFPRAHFQKYFPALEEQLFALLTLPLIPCAAAVGEVLPGEDNYDHVDGRHRYQSGRLLRDSLLGLGLGDYGSRAESLLEPVMTLLSSTGWSATYDFDKDVSGVLRVLAPT